MKTTIEEKIVNIRKKLNIFDDIVRFDYENPTRRYLNERQVVAVKAVLELLQELNWNIALSKTKEINTSKNKFLQEDPFYVRITPCAPEYEGKTFLGLHLGEMACHISCSISKNTPEVLDISPSYYNPAIFVFDLNKIIYGAESFWGKITKEDILKGVKDISSDDINSAWYMRALKSLGHIEEEKEEEKPAE